MEEQGVLDTSRANDFDGSFLKVAEFDSEHQPGNNSPRDSEEDDCEYVDELQTSTMKLELRKNHLKNQLKRKMNDGGSAAKDQASRNLKRSITENLNGTGLENMNAVKSFRMQSILEHKDTQHKKAEVKNLNQMSIKITDLEQKIYQLESEKQALESCMTKM